MSTYRFTDNRGKEFDIKADSVNEAWSKAAAEIMRRGGEVRSDDYQDARDKSREWSQKQTERNQKYADIVDGTADGMCDPEWGTKQKPRSGLEGLPYIPKGSMDEPGWNGIETRGVNANPGARPMTLHEIEQDRMRQRQYEESQESEPKQSGGIGCVKWVIIGVVVFLVIGFMIAAGGG